MSEGDATTAIADYILLDNDEEQDCIIKSYRQLTLQIGPSKAKLLWDYMLARFWMMPIANCTYLISMKVRNRYKKTKFSRQI